MRLVQLGAAYMSYGQYDKAVATSTRDQKGGLKSVDEANLLLGIAQLRAKNTAEAQQAFDKVATSTTPAMPAWANCGRCTRRTLMRSRHT